MSEVTARAVVMGKDILVGCSGDDIFSIGLGMALEFSSQEDLMAALLGDAVIRVVVLDSPPQRR